MSNYDYSEAKKRVLTILNSKIEIEQVDKLPKKAQLSYSKGYYSWVTAVFVDIRDSTTLFQKNKKKSTAKIIRSFASEIIRILRNDDNLIEIGTRGDCVYAIFSCLVSKEDEEVFSKIVYINSFLKILNKTLEEKKMKKIRAGIGVSRARELVLMVETKENKIDDLVWIGEAVTNASKYSSMANTQNIKNPIVMSSSFYNQIIESIVKDNGEANNWFHECHGKKGQLFYSCDILDYN